MSAPIRTLGVATLSRALAAGQVSSIELTQELLAGVKAHANLGAFLAVDEAAALAQAKSVTKMSLCAMGTPVSTPARPCARRASAACAWVSAAASSTARKAPRSTCAFTPDSSSRVSSALDTWPAAKARDSAATPSVCSGAFIR